MNNTELIKSVLQFTDDDLAANREGHLSKHQIEQLSRTRSLQWFGLYRLIYPIALGFVPACLCSSLFLVIVRQPNTRLEFNPTDIMCVIYILSVIAMAGAIWGVVNYRLRQTFARQSVECVTGTLIRGKSIGSEFSLTVAESQLKTPSELHGMLEDGANYRIYSLQGEVLAFERLGTVDSPMHPIKKDTQST